MILVLLALALFFDFLNGFHDSSNVVATPISSNAMHPRLALGLAAVAEFVAPFLFGVAVATTIGDELLNVEVLEVSTINAALAGAITWNLITWYFGIPSSSSHALVGGLVGAAVLAEGVDAVNPEGLLRVLIALLISPVLGMAFGWVTMQLVILATSGSPPSINSFFRRSQVVTLTALALSHGTNDAQKTMGVITMGLVAAGVIDSFVVPTWVVALSATAIALGTFSGGWRLIRTLGGKIYRIRPVHAFSSQVAGAGVIFGAALLGGPVSTTQVMSSSIMGVGAADRINMVRWGILREMTTAWVLTIPVTALLAGLFYLLIQTVM
jgi:PiT family inorganic phosphate transporter